MSSRRSVLSLGYPRAILSALTRAGYETIQDISTSTPDGLARDLNISLDAANEIYVRSQKPSTPISTLPMTQPASVIAQQTQKLPTGIVALDKILQGGVSRGRILEISGPPGSPKELVAMSIVSSFVNAREEVLFVDCQNMANPGHLCGVIERLAKGCPNATQLVHHLGVHTLPALMLFAHRLLATLDSHPKVTLLVLNSISFPFQFPSLSISHKNELLERLKRTLSKALASKNLAIVSTSQLSTKLLKADGSTGTFDTGTKGILVPQLGLNYLPTGRTQRVIISPEGPLSGFFKLLSSSASNEQFEPILEPYVLFSEMT